MREKTIGTLIALGLSAPFAMAQEIVQSETKAGKTETAAKIVRPGNKTGKEETAVKSGGAVARPETTGSKVIADTLNRGEEMHLTIRFKVDSDQIRGRAHKQILEIATALKGPKLSGRRIGVQGHTDADGDDDYNLDLSYRRSVTVVRTLVNMYGIEPGRLDVMGYGETRPVASNRTADGKAMNRRVTLVNISAMQKKPQ